MTCEILCTMFPSPESFPGAAELCPLEQNISKKLRSCGPVWLTALSKVFLNEIRSELCPRHSWRAKRTGWPSLSCCFSLPSRMEGCFPLRSFWGLRPTVSLPSIPSQLPSTWLPGCHANKVPMVTGKSCYIPIGSSDGQKSKRDHYVPGHKKKKAGKGKERVLTREMLQEGPFFFLAMMTPGWTLDGIWLLLLKFSVS